MASLAPQSCCLSGVKHEGTPKGSVIDIADIKAYVSGDKASGKAILLVTDVWGFELNNTRLIADTFAEQGYYVVVPDLFAGDIMKSLDEFADWLTRHGVEVTEPKVLKALEWIQTTVKPKYINAIGYCFGAKYALRLGGRESAVNAVAIAHPSLVTIEEVANLKKPLLISGAQTDPVYTPELRAQTEAKLKEINATYFLTETSGVMHGFAVRGDPKDKWQVIAKDKAFNDTLWWFSLFE